MLLDTVQPISTNSRRKLPLVVEELSKLAQRLGHGAKLPTARELSAALSVTGATLTRALEQLESRGVLRCRQGSGIYVESGVGQKRVGLVFGENIFSTEASPFGALILQHSAKRAKERNERFSFYIDSPACYGTMDGVEVPAHQDLADALKEGKLDGVALIARSTVEQETWLRSLGVPVVSAKSRLGSIVPGMEVVMFDYQALMQLGLKRLREAGCRTVGLIGVLREHEEIYRRALAETDLVTRDSWVICPEGIDARPAEEHEGMGRHLAEKFLSREDGLPDGLLLTDDMMATGVLSTLEHCDVAVGESLKICSHTNVGSRTLASWNDRILTVKFNPQRMAAAFFDMLDALMDGKNVLSPYLLPPEIE